MHKSHYIVLLAMLFSLPIASQLYEVKKGSIAFHSNAPQENIDATSKELSGLMNLTANNFAFAVDVNTFKGFNSALQQEHFYENYMQTDVYPKATFSGKLIDKFNTETNTQIIRAKGTLDVHGVKQERIIEVQIQKSSTGYSIHSEFNILLQDHGIMVPKIVNQKIAENIAVIVKGSLVVKN